MPRYLDERAEAIESVQASVARHVKRALNDEQNEVLDALRRAAATRRHRDARRGADRPRRPVPAGPHARPSHRDRWPAPGRWAVTASRPPTLSRRSSVEIDVELVTPLRERLAKALEDAGGDPVEAGATLRAAYREWRMQRADEAAGHLGAAGPWPRRLRRACPPAPRSDGSSTLGSPVPRRRGQRAGRRRSPRASSSRPVMPRSGPPRVPLRNRASPGRASPAVRVPSDLPVKQAAWSPAYVQPRSHRHHRRGGAACRAVPVARGIAGFYTDYLWFDALGLSGVFGGVLGAKVGLGRHLHRRVLRAARGLNLLDRRPPRARFRPPGPRRSSSSGTTRSSAGAAGSSASVSACCSPSSPAPASSGQWNEWILFTNTRAVRR